MSCHITDMNDIFLMFEVINMGKPERVMDFGMTLFRAGAVSRNIKNRAIPEDIVFDGYKQSDMEVFPVYKTIYNNIFQELTDGKYELGLLVRSKEVFDEGELSTILEWSKSHTDYLLIDGEGFEKHKGLFSQKSITPLSVENTVYYLIKM